MNSVGAIVDVQNTFGTDEANFQLSNVEVKLFIICGVTSEA
jgi:hypothetical protein